MAKETAAERRARIQKEVADASAARQKAYFEAQAKSKAAARAIAAPLPKPDAYTYDYAWRQDVGAPTGQLNLIKFQNPYYDASTNTIVDPATGERTDVIPSMVSGPTSFRGDSSTVEDPYAGLTPEQIEARKNAEELAARLGLSIDPNTGMIIKPPANFVIDPVTGKYTDPSKLSKPGKTETGRTTNSDGSVTITYSDGSKVTIPASNANNSGNNSNVNITSGLDAATIALIQSLQNQINTLTTGNAATAAATKAAEKLAERQSAFDVLRAEMDALGLGALVEPLRGLIQKDVSPSEFAVELRQSEAYKARFAANEGRLKKGLRVLTPGEYLRVEDAYRQTLRTYGLKQFDNDQYVRQFIENDISAAELSDRVATAVQRVQNADPAISRTLRDYYGIGQTDLVAYVLDPNQQLQKIQRQVAAAEIGVAARKQGLEAGVTVAEQLAAQGITEAEAQRGYATIADILPTSEKLSQIYGTTLEGYDQAQAEQEVFNQLASAQRKRQRLVSREIAEFSGQSGVARGSLGTSTGGQY